MTINNVFELNVKRSWSVNVSVDSHSFKTSIVSRATCNILPCNIVKEINVRINPSKTKRAVSLMSLSH